MGPHLPDRDQAAAATSPRAHVATPGPVGCDRCNPGAAWTAMAGRWASVKLTRRSTEPDGSVVQAPAGALLCRAGQGRRSDTVSGQVFPRPHWDSSVIAMPRSQVAATRFGHLD